VTLERNFFTCSARPFITLRQHRCRYLAMQEPFEFVAIEAYHVLELDPLEGVRA
jgi:hypothetical protein